MIVTDMFDHHKPVITLTGATGFLGSHLMNELLLRGYRVIAPGRKDKDESLDQRITKLLKWFGTTGCEGRLETIEVDYSKPLLGLSEQRYQELCAKTDYVIHCASDTCFSETKREKVLDFNVHNLKGILDFASHAHIKSFFYISTAYAAGINGEICREKLPGATDFVNIYEESKAKAEWIITNHCKVDSIPLAIIRPSIVYGDSKTGKTLRFNAFYFPIRSLLTVRDIYLNDIINHGGKRSRQQGISLDRDGYLFMPLRFHLPNKGGINLIPVDYFINASLKIIEQPSPFGIYNLTNDTPESLETLSAYSKKFLKVKGVEIVYGRNSKSLPQNPVEELFDRFVEPYRPYLSDERVFERINTDAVTGNMKAPRMTENIFKLCMEYAIEADWGEKIFN